MKHLRILIVDDDRDFAESMAELVVVVPVLGALGLLVYCGFMRGNLTDNRYGPDPLSSSMGMGIPAKLT